MQWVIFDTHVGRYLMYRIVSFGKAFFLVPDLGIFQSVSIQNSKACTKVLLGYLINLFQIC